MAPWLLLGRGTGNEKKKLIGLECLSCSGLGLESPSKAPVLKLCPQHVALLEDGTFRMEPCGRKSGHWRHATEEDISTPTLLPRQTSAIPPSRDAAKERGQLTVN